MAVSAFYSFKSVTAGQHASESFSSMLTLFVSFFIFLKKYYIIFIYNTSRTKGTLGQKATKRPRQQLHPTLMMLCRTSVQEGVSLCTQPPAAGNDTAVDMMCLEASLNCLHLAIA